MNDVRRVALSTGVTLAVAESGPPDAPPVILLHGFPESHRTWRALEPLLSQDFRLVMPDLRGFGGSDKPKSVEAYKAELAVDDLFALADALAIDRFALVGHDWGGAVAWSAALRGDPRISRLAIINSPHPIVFQKSLFENRAQRSASRYITAFRMPGFAALIRLRGLDWFFRKAFGSQVDLSRVSEADKQSYIAEWSRPGALAAMLKWYRAAPVIVPFVGFPVRLPDWVLKPFPKISLPTLVIWGMRDAALLPVQLDGLDQLVRDLAVVRLADAGHFAPWDAPDAVAGALAPFLACGRMATAPRP